MAATCDPEAQMQAAKCFECLADKQLLVVFAYNSAKAAGDSMDPKQLLINAKAFQGLTEYQLLQVIAISLCRIAG
jgi:hypothetical protein